MAEIQKIRGPLRMSNAIIELERDTIVPSTAHAMIEETKQSNKKTGHGALHLNINNRRKTDATPSFSGK